MRNAIFLSAIALVSWVALAVTAPSLAQESADAPQARVEAVVHALASGDAPVFESAAQANFSQAALARRTPEQRAHLVAQISETFGRFSIDEITQTADGIRVAIHGESGARAIINLTIAGDHKIDGLSFDLNPGPPGPHEVDASARAYTTADAIVPVADHAISTRLYAPIGRTRYPLVVLLFGSGGESEIDTAYTRIIAQAFASSGIGCLAFDKAGVGNSTGHFTGSDFEALGADAAALIRYARALPNVGRIGVWGSSQAGWALPYALRHSGSVDFAILMSPGGVDPFEQVAHFLHLQLLGWGLSPAQAQDADNMHRAVALYYAGRASYRSAQAEVNRYRGAPWFHRVVTNPYWDQMTPDGRILTPSQLAAEVRAHPDQFELYRSPSTFRSYQRDYESMRLPTLVIYGGNDQLVPIARSRQVLEAAFARDRAHLHEFHVFEGASHDIESSDGNVVPEYLSLMTTWARARFDGGR